MIVCVVLIVLIAILYFSLDQILSYMVSTMDIHLP